MCAYARRMRIWLCLALLLPSMALAELRAERITEANFGQRGVGGRRTSASAGWGVPTRSPA
jgi:hypothetical protein